MRRVLDASGVNLHATAGGVLVPLSELTSKLPDLWESVRLAERRLRDDDG